MRCRVVPFLLVVAAAAACSTDSVAPVAPAVAPSLATRAASATPSGRYIALMKANAIAADFATRAEELGGTVEFAHGGSGFAVVSGLTADAAVALGGEEDVAAVEADVTVAADPIGLRGADLAVAGAGAAAPATATRYSRQWNMHVIRADRAWATGRFGSPAVRVAILDSGIDYLHPELVGLVDLSR